MYDFTAHIPGAKKHTFSPHIRTWKLSDPATASQLQSAFKVKTMTAAAAVATAAGADADTANGSNWNMWCGISLVKAEGLSATTEVCDLSKNH